MKHYMKTQKSGIKPGRKPLSAPKYETSARTEPQNQNSALRKTRLTRSILYEKLINTFLG